MVILVRLRDGSCTIARESRLDGLISDGLVSEFLRNGEWIAAGQPAVRRDSPVSTASQGNYSSPAAPL